MGKTTFLPEPIPAVDPTLDAFVKRLRAAVAHPFGIYSPDSVAPGDRVTIATAHHARYFRRRVYRDEYPGSLTGAHQDIADMLAAGFKLVLTYQDNDDGPDTSENPVVDLSDGGPYISTLGDVIADAQAIGGDDAVAAVCGGNEVTSVNFFNGTMAQYGSMLGAVKTKANSLGVPVADSGASSLTLVLAMLHRAQLSGGDAAYQAYAVKVAEDAADLNAFLLPATKAAAAERYTALNAYLSVVADVAPDFINFHWYRRVDGLEEMVDFVRGQVGGLVPITNEWGLYDATRAAQRPIALMEKMIDLDVAIAILFDFDQTGLPGGYTIYAVHDTNPASGTYGELFTTGTAFKDEVDSLKDLLPQYQLSTEEGQPSGYAPLGADGKVPDAYLQSVVTRDAEAEAIALQEIADARGAASGIAPLGVDSKVPDVYLQDAVTRDSEVGLIAPHDVLFNTVGVAWAVPAGAAEFPGNTQRRGQADLTRASAVRLLVTLPAATGCPAGTVLAVQYSTDGGSSWDYLGAGTTPSVAVDSTVAAGVRPSAWVALDAAALADVQLRIVGGGGDGVGSGTFGRVAMQVR